MTSSQEEIAPTAMTGTPASCRMRSAYGVWYDRPNSGRSPDTTCPVDTSMASAPCAAKARAISTASSALVPPSAQSVAEIRTVMGRSPGHTSRTASKTSSGKRSRFSGEPP